MSKFVFNSVLMSVCLPNLFCQYFIQIGSYPIFINSLYICLVYKVAICFIFLPIRNIKLLSKIFESNLFFEIKIFHAFGMAVNSFCKWKTFLGHWTICLNSVKFINLFLISTSLRYTIPASFHLWNIKTLLLHFTSLLFQIIWFMSTSWFNGYLLFYCFVLTQTMILKLLYKNWEFCFLLFVLHQKPYN